ncbi:MAG: hypothetical protein WCI55_06615 [Armatimonadota bacterium]
MKSAILLVLFIAGCQQSNYSSETPPPSASTSPVELSPMPKTVKKGPISKPNRNGIALQAVENENQKFLTLKLINTGSEPIRAFNWDANLAVDCDITSVMGSEWRKEPMTMVDLAYVLPEKVSFVTIPGHQSISMEVLQIPIHEKIRAGTYIATVYYDDALANSCASRTNVKEKSKVGRTEKVKVLVETNGEGYSHATPIL